MPLFRPGPGPYALAVAMTGVRMGERMLHLGSGTPAMFGALAAKVGLSGRAAGADSESGAARLEQAAARAGVLVEVKVATPGSVQFESGGFDLVVVDCTAMSGDDARQWLPEALRTLRHGGRIIVAERPGGARRWRLGLWGLARAGSSGKDRSAVSRMLADHGFRPVRIIGERDGWRFTEGLKQNA
jgi:SAM-dependent methyltransferase